MILTAPNNRQGGGIQHSPWKSLFTYAARSHVFAEIPREIAAMRDRVGPATHLSNSATAEPPILLPGSLAGPKIHVTAGTLRCDSGHRFSGHRMYRIQNRSGVFKPWQRLFTGPQCHGARTIFEGRIMDTIIVATAIALGLACLVLLKSRSVDPDQLVQHRRAPLMMGVQIICGDCSGESYRPNRTYLDLNGHCAQCGGSNFLLASIVASHRARARAERLREVHSGPSRGRVIPFEAPVSRASRSRKIAV